LKQYLQAMASFYAEPPAGYTYASVSDLLLDRAVFDGSHEDRLTSEQKDFVTCALRGTRARYKECFGNSQQLAIASDRFTYREGYAYSGLVPMLHAWVLLDNQHVIDVTWRDRKQKPVRRIRGVVPPGWVYYGFTPPSATDRQMIQERLIRLKCWASYLDSDFFDDFEQKDLYKMPRMTAYSR